MDREKFDRAASLAGLMLDEEAAAGAKEYIVEMLEFMAPLADAGGEETPEAARLPFDALREDEAKTYGGAFIPADKLGEDGCYTAPLAVN